MLWQMPTAGPSSLLSLLLRLYCVSVNHRHVPGQANLSEVTFHRWKRQFGHLEVNEARRLKELERENTELKKMLAEEMLKNRVLSYVCEKKL